MSVDEQLAGDSDHDGLGRLTGVLEVPHEVEQGFCWCAQRSSAHIYSLLRRHSLPTRLILPGLRTNEPELCSLGKRPAKAAKAPGRPAGHRSFGQRIIRLLADDGVKSAILGSSASRIVAEISQKTGDGAQ
ncbi:MAG TPA: hypothetical protein VHL31_09525 [Geminicoccus sp.]|jgi:hypothetical protein|nr:hypothetical protein [Geminicoccus sp.]HEX2526522.1 hypothetical protein [Geminicoccus sp.]